MNGPTFPLEELLAGDARAWEDLVARTRPLLVRAVRAVLRRGEATEEVVQSVFAALVEDGYRLLRSFRGESRFETWLVAVARRRALLFERGEARRERRERAPRPSPEFETPLDAAAGDEERARVAAARERLAPRDRLLLALVYDDGRSAAEVARVLGVAKNSVSPLVGRARERLRKELEGVSRSIPGVRSSPPAATE
ncbi:MAG: sigma-70 family RNA polymerase sigma factor [Planctomycetes bacterium]|nr:sigma-70 family RNA polymerase sigma factor [Planctomycetota bacterium]